MKKKIALTGATGFVGRHVLSELVSNGYEVNALTRRPQPQQDHVNWIFGDLENQSALSELIDDTDALINVAGLIKAKSEQEFFGANTSSVKRLLEIAKKVQKPFHFIQISTLAAREDKISHYAASKSAAEKTLAENAEHINWTMIRPPAVYGPGDQETLKIFKTLKWRLALIPGNADNRVSWIHVSDLAQAIIRSIDNEKYFSKILETDDGAENGYSHLDFYDTASSLMNIRPIKITLPKFILQSIGHVNDIFGRIFRYAPMLSAQKVNELCHDDWVSDKTMSMDNADWQPEYELRKGLEQTLDWYKNKNYI